MKRLILLLICALYVTTAAQAQISFYGEWCRKGSGEKTIMIFDMKEKKAYVMNEARKTCMVMEEIDKDFICNTIQGRPIKPKTLGQKDYVEQIRKKKEAAQLVKVQ